MIETVFFTVAGNAEFKLRTISFGSLADDASMKSLLGRRFALELALAHARFSPFSQFRVGGRPEENEIVEERNKDSRFCAKGTPKQV